MPNPVRKKYPKCTVYAGTSDHPDGPVSVQDAYNWPTLLLDRLSGRFGSDWLCHRLLAWKWNFSTAFSGVGAPESVTRLILFSSFCGDIILINKIIPAFSPSGNSVPCIFEALASLQSAAASFLRSNGFEPATNADPHVCSEFACEVDKSCQKVLGETYQCCCFQDILTFNPESKTEFCATHKKKCRVRKNHVKAKGQKRYSA